MQGRLHNRTHHVYACDDAYFRRSLRIWYGSFFLNHFLLIQPAQQVNAWVDHADDVLIVPYFWLDFPYEHNAVAQAQPQTRRTNSMENRATPHLVVAADSAFTHSNVLYFLHSYFYQ